MIWHAEETGNFAFSLIFRVNKVFSVTLLNFCAMKHGHNPIYTFWNLINWNINMWAYKKGIVGRYTDQSFTFIHQLFYLNLSLHNITLLPKLKQPGQSVYHVIPQIRLTDWLEARRVIKSHSACVTSLTQASNFYSKNLISSIAFSLI